MKGLVNSIIQIGGGNEITAYNYTNKEIKQGDWVHYNERVDNASDLGNYTVASSYSLGFVAVAPNVLIASHDQSPNRVYVITIDEENKTTTTAEVASGGSYGQIVLAGIDKDGYAYSNSLCFRSLNYEKGHYWLDGNSSSSSANAELWFPNISYSKAYIVNKETGEATSYSLKNSNGTFFNGNYAGGYKVSNDSYVCAYRDSSANILTIITKHDDILQMYQEETSISCLSVFGGLNQSIIFCSNAEPGQVGTMFTVKYENSKVIPYSKENFPSAMQECFDNACRPFWNEQYGIFTAYIPTTKKFVCCQYINNKWIDKSPLITYTGSVYNETTIEGPVFFISPDLSRAFIHTNYFKFEDFAITSASDGNYLVPYSFTNSETKMGKAKADIVADIGAEGTILVP